MKTYRKGTSEKVTYTADFCDRLADDEYITAVTWTVDSGITTSGSDHLDYIAEITAEGGTVNATYQFQAVVDTNKGLKHERTFAVMVVAR